jgi:hypothetical protein
VKILSNLGLVLALVAGLVVGVVGSRLGASTATGGALAAAASDRGLTGDQAEAALATFVAPGEHDDYLMFASGGHSGQMHVIGMPSMHLLKTIPVFTPDAWAGYGLGADWSMEILEEGTDPDKHDETLLWGDAHHPALSETDGDYDGRFVYVNDRANGRIGMVDLRDFKPKQILDLPNLQTSHGGVFATPNTEYVHISAKTPIAGLGGRHLRRARRLRGGVPRHVDLAPRGPGDRPHVARGRLPDRAAALQPGPRRRRQGCQRRLGVHQLLQHRDGDRRDPRR